MLYLLASAYMSKLKMVIDAMIPMYKWLEIGDFTELYLTLTKEAQVNPFDHRVKEDKIILDESCLDDLINTVDVKLEILSTQFKEVILITHGKTNHVDSNIKRVGRYQSVHQIISCLKDEQNKLILYSNLVSSEAFSDLFIRLSKILTCSYRLSLNYPVRSQAFQKSKVGDASSEENRISLYDYNLSGKLNLIPHHTYRLIDNLTDYITPPIDILMKLIHEIGRAGDTLIESDGIKSPLDFEIVNTCHWIIFVYSKSTEDFVDQIKHRFPNKKYILLNADVIHFETDDELKRHISAQMSSGVN